MDSTANYHPRSWWETTIVVNGPRVEAYCKLIWERERTNG